MLALVHEHPRDKHVKFEESSHTYSINGSSDGYISVTTLIHSLFPHFDADEVISKMFSSYNWKDSKYFGKTREQIKSEWASSGKEAAGLGTKMHANIEAFYNGERHETESKEWKLFEEFNKMHEDELESYRSEMIVYAEDLKIAGSIDMIYSIKDQPNKYVIYDWKRSKKIKTDNEYQKGTHELTKKLPDCNLVHYSLQLTIYKEILTQYYGMDIVECNLIILHPDQNKFVKIRVEDSFKDINYRDIVLGMFKERKELVGANKADDKAVTC